MLASILKMISYMLMTIIIMIIMGIMMIIK